MLLGATVFCSALLWNNTQQILVFQGTLPSTFHSLHSSCVLCLALVKLASLIMSEENMSLLPAFDINNAWKGNASGLRDEVLHSGRDGMN